MRATVLINVDLSFPANRHELDPIQVKAPAAGLRQMLCGAEKLHAFVSFEK
jgi:hypothetical protein